MKPTTMLPLLLLLPIAAHAQEPADAQARMEAAIDRAVEQGIPAALVESKIAEGRAKRVPADRIAQAAERRAEALVRARDAFARGGVEPRSQDLSVGADAISGGVSESAITAIAARAPQDRRLVAIDVMRELVRMDVPAADALDRVTGAMQRGTDALANLPAQAMEARDRRGPPEDRGPGQARPTGVPEAGGEGRGRRGPPRTPPRGPPHH